MTFSVHPCRHRREPRHRGVYHCRSPRLVGARLVTSDICGACPFRDHASPGEGAPCPDGVHPAMGAAALAALLEGPPLAWPAGWEDWPVTRTAHALAVQRFLDRLPPYPLGRYRGRGVVLAGGGARYFPSLYVTVRALRAVGCRLPVQAWYLGRDDEMPPRYAELLAAHGVECVDGDAVRARHPCRILNGWELKAFAALHSPFEEVLLLDADCYPVRCPAALFDEAGYRQAGAIFWPDLPDGPALNWGAFGVAPTGRASVESGQALIDKRTCWLPLNLAWWYNDHSDWSYLHGYGDKHTFEVAWARCGLPFHRFREVPDWSGHSFLHAGPDGRTLFVHRCRDKFRFAPADYLTPQPLAANHYHPGLPLEDQCFAWLAELAGELGAPRRSAAVPADGPPRLRAYVYSCPERGDALGWTLAHWRATDWGDAPAAVLDDGAGPPSPERILAIARRMLARAAGEPADYYLFLEDDLLFALHLRECLVAWPPLREGWLWMGTLYNPGLPLRGDAGPAALWGRRYLPLDPAGYYGTQAVVLSRAALHVVLREWDTPGPYDLRLARIAGRHGRGVVAHTPSLVQHVPVSSTWGGVTHRAADFDPFFRPPVPGSTGGPGG